MLTKTNIVLLSISGQALAGGCLCGALGILGASQALADWELYAERGQSPGSGGAQSTLPGSHLTSLSLQAGGSGCAVTQTLSVTQLSSPPQTTENPLPQAASLTLVTAGAGVSSEAPAASIPPWPMVAHSMNTVAH